MSFRCEVHIELIDLQSKVTEAFQEIKDVSRPLSQNQKDNFEGYMKYEENS